MNLPQKLRLHEGEDLIFRVRADGSAEVLTRETLARRGRGLFAGIKTEADETEAFLQERKAEAEESMTYD